MENTSNDVVLINGTSNEVGQSLALHFANNGSKVAVTGRDKDAVDRLVAQIKEVNGTAMGIVADPTQEDEVKTTIRQTIDQLGKLDVLVNNLYSVGNAVQGKNAVDLSAAVMNETMKDTLNPMFLFSREAVMAMRENKYGRIINIGSLYYLGFRGKTHQSAANSAIFGFTRALALESAIDNITVNCIAVGDLSDPDLSETDMAKMTGSIPVGRLGKAEDIDHAVHFFAAPSAKYITGQTLFVCGGKSIHFSMSV